LKVEIAVLQEQKTSLEWQLDNLKNKVADDARLHANALASVSEDFNKKLAYQESSSNRVLQAEERRTSRVEKDLGDAKKELSSVKKESEESKKTIAVLQEKLAISHSELESAKSGPQLAPMPETQLEEIDNLKSQVQNLINRAKSINERHKQGDLVRLACCAIRRSGANDIIRATKSENLSIP
jgi:chromosome segregation ATPase